MDRRGFIAGSAAAATMLAALPAPAQDTYPSGAITLINPFPPGGAVDAVARPLAGVLEQQLKQSVVIETRPGAAGLVGARYVANAVADGYTLLLHSASLAGFAEVDRLYGRPVRFTRADFIPIARLIADPMVLIVNGRQPYATLRDFVDDVGKRPNQLAYSSSGPHGALHLPMALFLKAAGLEMKHVPTNGGGPALAALLGNSAQALVSSIAAASAQIRAGKVRALASFGARRDPAFPDVPTMKEQGYDVEFYLWVGLFAPKRTAEPIIVRLREEIGRAAATNEFRQAIKSVGQEVAYMDQPEFKAFWDADARRVEEAVRQIGKI